MVDTSVSSSVLAIIGSFATGLDVFKKLKEKRRRSKRRALSEQQRVEREESRLARSLKRGPEDIGRNFQSYTFNAVGEQVKAGDAIAQNSLAEILLRLNGGLVGIITSFLGRKDQERLDLDYRSLTDLSEQSRVQTVGVLRGLYQRMLARRTPTSALTCRTRQALTDDERRYDGGGLPKRSKIRGPTLARVIVQDSSRPSHLAIVRPVEGKKKPRSRSQSISPSSIEADGSLSRATTAVASSQLSLPPTLPSQLSLDRVIKLKHHRGTTAPAHAKPQQRAHNSSAGAAYPPPEPLRTSKSAPRLLQSKSTPRLSSSSQRIPDTPMPDPLSPPLPYSGLRRRKETPTYYSTNSGSTKLGEIPMHKWPVPYDFDAMSVLNREALANGWPRMEDAVEKKRRGGFLGLFRRKDSGVA